MFILFIRAKRQVSGIWPGLPLLTEKKLQESISYNKSYLMNYIICSSRLSQTVCRIVLIRIVREGRISPGDSVLDIGTGTGILIPLIEKYTPRNIYACDLSERMLAQLQKSHPHVKTFLADIRELQLPNDSIDVVFLTIRPDSMRV